MNGEYVITVSARDGDGLIGPYHPSFSDVVWYRFGTRLCGSYDVMWYWANPEPQP